jgi:thiamine biosynthesis lipoprotein
MRQRHTIDTWGTKLYFDCEGEGFDSVGAFAEISSFVLLVDDLFSTYKPDSVISQIRSGRMNISDAPADVIEVANLCAVARELTDGAFDPWSVPGGFDPSGYVKGWAADKCADIAQEHGAQHVQVNCAGDLALRGGFNDAGEIKPWSIGISNPDNTQEVVHVVEIFDGAIATSGDYERGAHIHDPYTGMIAIGARSASVIGPDAGLCDALATALMVAGKDGAKWFGLPELASYSAWVVNRNENTAWSVND